jgi:hypothetical protein
MDVSDEGKVKQKKESIHLCRANRGQSALDNRRHATQPLNVDRETVRNA